MATILDVPGEWHHASQVGGGFENIIPKTVDGEEVRQDSRIQRINSAPQIIEVFCSYPLLL